jgi:hypothetical protein
MLAHHKKRDVLLSYATGEHSASWERSRYLDYGEEDDKFISNLVITCSASEDRDCVKTFYNKKQMKQKLISEKMLFR